MKIDACFFFFRWLKKVGPIINPELGIDLRFFFCFFVHEEVFEKMHIMTKTTAIFRKIKITDGGDVTAQSEMHLEEAHTALTQKVFNVMQRGKEKHCASHPTSNLHFCC